VKRKRVDIGAIVSAGSTLFRLVED
jgi:hypothetical protein